MKTTSRISIVIVTCFVLGCAGNDEELQLGASQTFQNLRLYPIYANRVFLNNRKNLGPYLMLKEAVDQGKVLVTEHIRDNQEGRELQAEVNTLFIENVSSDTVIILNGETVEGGRQDRMIAQEVLLKPHSGKLDLSVFCVEHGR